MFKSGHGFDSCACLPSATDINLKPSKSESVSDADAEFSQIPSQVDGPKKNLEK